jgi:hypothetical protein
MVYDTFRDTMDVVLGVLLVRISVGGPGFLSKVLSVRTSWDYTL